jgi:hypothetical protein
MEVRMSGFIPLFPPYAFTAYERILLFSSLHRKKKSNATRPGSERGNGGD